MQPLQQVEWMAKIIAEISKQAFQSINSISILEVSPNSFSKPKSKGLQLWGGAVGYNLDFH